MYLCLDMDYVFVFGHVVFIFVLDMYLDIFLHVSSIMLCGRVPLYVFGITG